MRAPRFVTRPLMRTTGNGRMSRVTAAGRLARVEGAAGEAGDAGGVGVAGGVALPSAEGALAAVRRTEHARRPERDAEPPRPAVKDDGRALEAGHAHVAGAPGLEARGLGVSQAHDQLGDLLGGQGESHGRRGDEVLPVERGRDHIALGAGPMPGQGDGVDQPGSPEVDLPPLRVGELRAPTRVVAAVGGVGGRAERFRARAVGPRRLHARCDRRTPERLVLRGLRRSGSRSGRQPDEDQQRRGAKAGGHTQTVVKSAGETQEQALLRWTPLSRAAVEVWGVGRLVMVVGVLGPGDRCEGNDDCHSEMRGSGPQDSVRS